MRVCLGELILGAIGRGRAATAPDLRQVAGVIGVDQILDGRLELSDADVAAVREREFVSGCEVLHKTFYSANTWGYQSTNQALVAQGRWENANDSGASYTYLSFTDLASEEGAMVLLGGVQEY